MENALQAPPNLSDRGELKAFPLYLKLVFLNSMLRATEREPLRSQSDPSPSATKLHSTWNLDTCTDGPKPDGTTTCIIETYCLQTDESYVATISTDTGAIRNGCTLVSPAHALEHHGRSPVQQATTRIVL